MQTGQKADWPRHKADCGITLQPGDDATITEDGIYIAPNGESLRDLEETMPPGVRHIGYDGRGWVILDALWSGPGVETIFMEVKNKPLTLVLESSVPLRVYVNPMLGEGDEWEKPPGSGNRVEVNKEENMIGVRSKHRLPC